MRRKLKESSVSCVGSDETKYYLGNSRVSSVLDTNKLFKDNTIPKKIEIDDKVTIHSLVSEISKKFPDKVAIKDELGFSYTYKELDKKANAVALHLQLLYAENNDSCFDKSIGVCIERSCNMVIAMLGILKAGAGYIPLDPSFPPSRLGWYAHDSDLDTIISQKSLETFVSKISYEESNTIKERNIILMDDILDYDTNAENIDRNDGLAYMIYTSGSTGKPKGVMLQHSSVINLLNSFRKFPGLTSDDIVIGVTTICFDIHIIENWLTLTTGATLIITKKQTSIDGYALQKVISDNNATLFQATPSSYRILLECGWKGKKDLNCICGGEPLPVSLAKQLIPIIKGLYNGYGPTETTVYSTIFLVTQQFIDTNPHNIPIGAVNSVDNTTIYILDPESLTELEIGEIGAIYVGGRGMARGYKNKEHLTKEKFIKDNIVTDLGGIMYCSGDLGKIRNDGLIECLGRIDNQVKIHGYRIELGEIEAEIDLYPNIKNVVVIVVDNPSGEKQLVAYIVTQDKSLNCKDIQEKLSIPLPDYMVPKIWITMESLPLLPNGKIDRKTLPPPNWEDLGNSCETEKPTSKTEEILYTIANELLPSSIGINDNFFVHGGNSLFAVRLFNMINEKPEFNDVDLEINQIFRSPTISKLAAIIDGQCNVGIKLEGIAAKCIVPLQVEGNLPPLFIVHPAGGLVFPYFQLASKLAPHQPLYAIQDPHIDNDDALDPNATIETIARDYVTAIQAVDCTGPYLLAGWSVGGNIAYEMAQQLYALHKQVNIVILIDSDFTEKYEATKALRQNIIGGFKGGLVTAGVEVQHRKFKEEIEKGKEKNNFQTKARVGAALTQAFLVACDKIQSQEDLRDDNRLDAQKISEERKQLAKQFYKIVKVKDRKYRLTTYKRCFTGKGAVNSILENNLAPNKDEAIKLAQSLMDEGVFHHVLGDHQFENAHLFYRFRVDEHRCEFTARENVEVDLVELAKRMHTELDIKDRRYRLKIYKSCFLGSHCVAWFLENRIVNTEKEAIEIGNKLVDNKIIAHVTKDHRFANKNYFYKFLKSKQRQNSGLSVDAGAVSEGFSDVKTPQASRLLQLLEWHFKIGSKYVPQIYEGRVSLIRCVKPFKKEKYKGWFSTCEFLTVTDIRANHYNVVADPHCNQLADHIRALLQDAST